MDVTKIYVPDPQKWIKYYQHMADIRKPSRIYQWTGINQSGGSISGIGNSYMIPVESSSTSNISHKDNTNVKLISPAQSTVDQAASEIKRTVTTSNHKGRQRRQRKHTRKKPSKVIKRKSSVSKHKRKKHRKSLTKRKDIFTS